MKTNLERACLVSFGVGCLLVIVATNVGLSQVQLSIQSGVQLSWPTATNSTYQLQSSSDPVTTWTNLLTAIGTGTTNTFYDPYPNGARSYQVLEIIPGTPASSSIPTNGGFEFGSGSTAANWTLDTAVGGPVYGVRTNDSPHGGSFNFQIRLASIGAGPVVQFNQAGIPVTGGTTYPFTFFAKALTGSTGYTAEWRILWNAGGDTGYHAYTPGNNVYTSISNSVVAPASATSATIYFHFAGAAITNQSATIDIDDVALGSGSSPGSPTVTNVLPVAVLPLATISWPSVADVQYFRETSTNLTASWNTNFPVIVGDGSIKSFTSPMTNTAMFFRLRIPASGVLPPTSLHQVSSGSTNAIGVAWTASLSPGVTGYRILYGAINGSTTNSTDLGLVTSAVISGLTSGQTYFVSVVTLSSSGQSNPADATITAQPDTDDGIVPLFDALTQLEPDTTVDTPTALITYLGDRARDRHAREADFHIYDHYLSWYWEDRTIAIEIVDQVAKGGTGITVNYQTLIPLSAPEFRAFFLGVTTVAQYNGNYSAPLIGPNLYSVTLTNKMPENRPLIIGDRMELEISQFLQSPAHGRNNYYGTAILYVVGQGIVPWQAGVINDPPQVNAALDSTPLPTNAWLGGKTTLPYQYSNEPEHRFKQLAGNIAPTNSQPFMLGRRLHHTDFGDGAHSEPDNPIFAEQVGKLGPKFINRSCVSCHVNNGRALPPGIGVPMLQSVVHVGADANGAPHPTLVSVLQPQSTSGPNEGNVTISSYTTINGQYGDSTPYTLQKPNYSFSGTAPAFYSVRIAPQLVGMGLLEAVSEGSIEALADPNDSDADGISGRVRIVTDPEDAQTRLGRFTYRGGRARISHQIAAALNTDMGATTSIFPILDGDTTGGTPELSDDDLAKWTKYVALLGVSARRDLTNSLAIQGQALFGSASCWKCHTPTLTTSPYHPHAELRNQTIHPYTDLLLHDMGAGLADNMGEGDATGSEWRTSPLWSIGLTPGVSGGEAYLHDGRARTLEEAILWHGGEAEASKEAFRNMSAAERAALIAFLKSL